MHQSQRRLRLSAVWISAQGLVGVPGHHKGSAVGGMAGVPVVAALSTRIDQ